MPKQPLWPVWGMLLGSVALYAALPLLLLPGGAAVSPQPVLVATLAGIAVTSGLASFAIRRAALSARVRSGALDLASEAGASRFFAISLLTWALSETVGLFGVVLYSLYRTPQLLYPFVAASLLLLVLHAPRRSSLQAVASPSALARPDVKIG